MSPDFVETRCLFCDKQADREMFRERLYPETFTGYTFSARRARRRENYRIVQCRQCSLIRSNPILTEDLMNKLYEQSQYLFSEEVSFATRTYCGLLDALRERHAARIDSIMDIGCSTGHFLDAALDMGVKDVLGFEPSRQCVAYAPERVRDRIIQDVYKPELLEGRLFDAICSFHVIDHLRDPASLLQTAVKNLKPGGHAMIVCHDAESWNAKLLGTASPVFDVEHIYLFSKKTLAMLLEKAGLEVLEVNALGNQYPLSYWLRMLPGGAQLNKILPGMIKKVPVRITGNLYIFGRKTR